MAGGEWGRVMPSLQKGLSQGLTVGGNLVPLYGVIAWHWDIFSVFFLFWAENAIIGVYTLLMMAAYGASRGVFAFIGSLFTMGFFVFHYGLFCMAHVAILTEIFGPSMDHHNFQPGDLVPLLLSPKVQGFYWGIAGLAVAQGFRCFDLYVSKYAKEKRIEMIMFSPYGRIVVLHVAILVGGLLAQQLGEPLWALAVLIVLKTLYDVGALKAGGNSADAFKVEVQDERSQKNS